MLPMLLAYNLYGLSFVVFMYNFCSPLHSNIILLNKIFTLSSNLTYSTTPYIQNLSNYVENECYLQ